MTSGVALCRHYGRSLNGYDGSNVRRSHVGQQADENTIRGCHEDVADLPLPNVVGYLADPEVWSKGYWVGLHDVLDHGRGVATQALGFHDAKDDVIGIDHDTDTLTGGSHSFLEIAYPLM
jgi:hypothetical protein